MKSKYLPIGTICSLANEKNNIMIIGYFSSEYTDKLITYDYIGCSYPEGLLLKNNFISFNHDEIEKVIYMGYESELFNNFNQKINNTDTSKEISSTIENNDVKTNSFIFDKNGTVISENTTSNVNKAELDTNNSEQIDKFKFDENGVVVLDNSNETGSSIESDAKNLTNNNNPFNLNYETNNNITINNDRDIFKFDENGFVVEDNSTNATSNSSNQKYVFDENGFVVEEI